VTAPPERIIFIPSPTLISSSTISARGSISRNPLVGFGVVGTKTVQSSPAPARRWGSACARLVRKPIVQQPGRGYCTSTTWLNRLRFCDPNVATICRTALYTAPTPGIRWMVRSARAQKNLPST